MSIFGTSAPKFTYDLGGGGEDVVLLDYCEVLEDRPVYEVIEHVSIINDHREFVERGKHWLFKVKLNFFKESDALAKYEEVNQYLGSSVALYRHRDANELRDSSNNTVLFTITEVTPGYLEQWAWKDILFITFESEDFVELDTTT